MKILFIANGFPPHRWAGTETYTAGIAKAFHERGHLVHVLCAGRWEVGERYWNGWDDDCLDGIQVRRLNLNWKKAPDPFRYLYDNPVVGQHLQRYLEQLRPDLVHVTSCETMSASVLRTTKEAGIPLVLSLTDFWFLCPRITLLHSDGSLCDGRTTAWECLRCQLFNTKAYRWPRRVLPERLVSALLMKSSRYAGLTRQRGLRGMAGDMADRKAFLRQAIGWPDLRITASSFVRNVYAANGVSAPITVHAYGHDLSWLRGHAGKTPSQTVRIGFIGQITKAKGLHLLLQAYRSLQDSFRGKLSLFIYGNMRSDDAYCDGLAALAATMDGVEFRGTYLHEQSAAVFADLDVLVVPSMWYDFPLIIHEAFATKTPVVATNLGSVAENVAHEVNGLLFERGDVADLARQLRRIVAEPGLTERLAAEIPPVKTIEQETDELAAIYDLIVRERPRH